MDAITLENLTKYYGKTCGVKDLSLRVAEGEFFGFIGPNGAGKSTTIRTLLGLLRPSAGSARLFGHSAAEEGAAALAQVGYLPAEVRFWPGLRVQEIIQLSAALHRQDCAAEARRLCERLALDPGKKADALSLGNRKKLGIVCALQHRPRLCLLDEPTSGLDPLMQREFFALLQERSAQGATIFFSSHILSEVQRTCQRAAILRQGQLVACDSVRALAGGGVKRVRVTGQPVLDGLDGIRDWQRTEQETTFLYQGPPQPLLRCLAEQHLQDVEITEPALEEVFLHFYQDAQEEEKE